MIELLCFIKQCCPHIIFPYQSQSCWTGPDGHNKCDGEPTGSLKLPVGGGRQHEFPFETIVPYILLDDAPNLESTFSYIGHFDGLGLLAHPSSQTVAHTQIPLDIILLHLSLKSITAILNIQFGSHLSKSDLISQYKSHSCVSCNLYYMVFLIVDSKLTRDRTASIT